MDKNTKILIIAIALALIVAIASTTYAFFTIANKEGEETVITSGTMGLHLEDGPEVGLNNAIPGASVTKTFYVKNTGNVDTAYDIYLSEVVNTFVDKTDLVYTLTSNDGGYSTNGQVEAPSISSKIVDSQPISVGGIQHYTLVITFLEKNENQDDNQGVEFSGKIQINEYKDSGSSTGGEDPVDPTNPTLPEIGSIDPVTGEEVYESCLYTVTAASRPYSNSMPSEGTLSATYTCVNGNATMISCAYSGTSGDAVCDGGAGNYDPLMYCTHSPEDEVFFSPHDYCNSSLKIRDNDTSPGGLPVSTSCSCQAMQSRTKVTCEPGTYLPSNFGYCEECMRGRYCEGGTFIKGEGDQGVKYCFTLGENFDTNYYGKTSLSDCGVWVRKGYYKVDPYSDEVAECVGIPTNDKWSHFSPYGEADFCGDHE